jgi:hypothetical protein
MVENLVTLTVMVRCISFTVFCVTLVTQKLITINAKYDFVHSF